MAKGGAGCIQGNSQIDRTFLPEDPVEHIAETIDGIGGNSSGGTQMAHSIKGPIDVGAAVDKVKCSLLFQHILLHQKFPLLRKPELRSRIQHALVASEDLGY